MGRPVTTPSGDGGHEVAARIFDLGGKMYGGVSKRIAAAAGVDQSTVSNWFAGRSNPSLEALDQLARSSGCSLEYLRTGKGDLFPQKPPQGAGAGDNHDMPQPVIRVELPMYGDIPAGPPVSAQEAPEAYPVLVHQAKEGSYVLRVHGDSMEPQITPGDLVLVKYVEGEPIEQFHNRVCAVLIDNETTLKRVQINKQNGSTWIYLKGDRYDYPTQSFRLDEHTDFRILGVVLKIIDRSIM